MERSTDEEVLGVFVLQDKMSVMKFKKKIQYKIVKQKQDFL